MKSITKEEGKTATKKQIDYTKLRERKSFIKRQLVEKWVFESFC